MQNYILLTVLLLITGCQTMTTNPKDQLFSNLDYLEQIEGADALAFAHRNNKTTDDRLKTDSRYQQTYDDIFKIVSAKDKLPGFFLLGDDIYSFWQDDIHVKGILRQTTVSSFNTGRPRWKIILDVDQLAKLENENWVYKGFTCLEPANEICLISLSRGGKDAHVLREFNLKSGEFVKNGFYIPESKSDATWFDQDTLFVGDATNPSSLTASGYPSEVKLLKRGQNISEAKVVLKTPIGHMSAGAYVQFAQTQRHVFLFDQISFYESDVYLYDINTGKTLRLPLPKSANFNSIFKGQLLFSTRESLQEFPAGSLLSIFLSDIENPQPKISAVFLPTKTRFFEAATFSKNHVWVTALDNVKKQVFKLSFQRDKWVSSSVKNANSVTTASSESHHVYFDFTDFLTPTSILYLSETSDGDPKKVISSPARFNSKPFQISQYKAKSKDGTEIPYFVVHRKDLKLSSANPTLLYGYGGFEIPMTPAYSGSTGKAWLEKGGVYVLANIRGGGEFGPDWHRSVLRENRQKVFDDFFAVAEDLIERKITAPAHLGIRGGSNGGLLTSVAFTQRPELFKAVISEVPLANMMEYHRWLAGASWMEEYGDPEDPKMRQYLLSYSPLHNLAAGKNYPEVFFLTSTKDDRVHPGHARQMVARLQQLGYPVLYNENTDGGHGRASNMKDTAEYLALEFTYLYQKLF